MEILRHAVVLVHLTGFAILFGAWVVEAIGQRRITRVMTWGMVIAAVAGLALAAPWGIEYSLNYTKLGVKLVILLIIGALLGIGTALILGIGLKVAAVSGTILLFLMYLAEFPLANGGTNPLIDAHILDIIMIITVCLTRAGDTWGLGKWWRGLVGVSWLR